MNTDNKPSQEWKLIPHSYQIADTGDYDGHFEITNSKITLYTSDDPDDEGPLLDVVKALNESGCKFWIEDNQAQLDAEIRHNAELQSQLSQLTAERDEAETLLLKFYNRYHEREKWDDALMTITLNFLGRQTRPNPVQP